METEGAPPDPLAEVKAIIAANIARSFGLGSPAPLMDNRGPADLLEGLKELESRVARIDDSRRAIAADMDRSAGRQFWLGLALSVPIGLAASLVARWLGLG